MSGALRQLARPVGRRRSAVGLVRDIAVRYARPDQGLDGTTGGALQQLCNGVALVSGQARRYADFWQKHNEQALAAEGPLWVVLGDSTAQGVGASSPLHGYVGLAYDNLLRVTGRPWRLVNLSRSGAVASDVLTHQLPRIADLPYTPELVTCGVGTNDILGTAPRQTHATLGALIADLPDSAVVLDLPLPVGLWGIGGICAPYVARVNRTIHAAARSRGLPVAEVSRHFTPPWEGKFAGDKFHPSDVGYRDQARAVLASIPL